MDKIYFGHPITYYNTTKEIELVDIISKHFPQYAVENPNQKHHQESYRKWKQEKGSGMEYYFQIVLPAMAAGIFLPFEDGMFGSGVFGEAEFLDKQDKPIYEMDINGQIKDMVIDFSRKLSIADTGIRVHHG